KYLHLVRYPLPKAPELVLAEELVKSLQVQRRLGGDAYPLTLSHLLELTFSRADPELVQKTLSQPAFAGEVILALPKQPDTPLALAQDRQLLVDSPLLLEKVLRLVRSESNQVATSVQLKGKVAVALRSLLEEGIMGRFASRSWPA